MAKNTGRIVRNGIEIVALTMMLLASGLIIRELWLNPRRQLSPSPQIALPREPLYVGTSPHRGDASATVVMFIYSDFQCPFCGKFARDTLPTIEREYVQTGRLQLVFRNLPLETIHPFAKAVAEAGLCANNQERFWPWHDTLFASTKPLEPPVLQSLSEASGLAMDEFNRCVASHESASQVQRDIQEAADLGIRSTPSFILGTRQTDGRVKAFATLAGAQGFGEFKVNIDRGGDRAVGR